MRTHGFGYKMAWLALRPASPSAAAGALNLQDVKPCEWSPGIEAAYEWPDPRAGYGTKVFITPPISGWVLCIGTPLFVLAEGPIPRFGDFIATLSAEIGGEVQYFATHRVVEAHSWGRAAQGELRRAYSYVGESGEKELDVGTPTSEEQELGFAFFDPSIPEADSEAYWAREDLRSPGEQDVLELASRWSIGPAALDENPIDVPAGLLGEISGPPFRLPTAFVQSPKKPWWKVW